MIIQAGCFKVVTIIISIPLKEWIDLYLNKLEYLDPRIICAKFGWNGYSGPEEDFKMS